jgi:hypothetical protein
VQQWYLVPSPVSGEGAPLSWRPSAVADAGNGLPLMRRPCADAVAGNGAKRPLRRRRRAKVAREEKRGGGDRGAGRRDIALGFGCWLDDGSEMLHALKAFALALTAEVKDEFTDSEAAIRSDIRHDLLCSTREGATFEPGLTLGA